MDQESFFNIPNVGDSDYDMVSFSVCDDCRWGIANFKVATVLFDLGAGPTPEFADSSAYYDAALVQGGFTFEVDKEKIVVFYQNLSKVIVAMYSEAFPF